MNDYLKPCPFCGGKAEFKSSIKVEPILDANGAYIDADTFYWEQTGCPKCDIWFTNLDDDEKEEITKDRWNRRAEDG